MHDRDEEFLDQLNDEAYERLWQVDNDARRLPKPYRTGALVHAATGVIDNGGLTYFFENDWPHNPPYSVYADAYERIGRVEAAPSLRDAAASFPLR